MRAPALAQSLKASLCTFKPCICSTLVSIIKNKPPGRLEGNMTRESSSFNEEIVAIYEMLPQCCRVQSLLQGQC